jgi:helicase
MPWFSAYIVILVVPVSSSANTERVGVAHLGAFIGIDKYQDNRIRELFGCRRDAEALWALFTDTLPDFNGELRTNEAATIEGIRNALDATLGIAGPEDVVIISVSSHGSRDHRLATHDSIPGKPETLIPMDELARRFKTSRAKCVLFILDCCFSGGAPARVVEDSPVTRDFEFNLEAIAGKGRLLIAASGINEPALEDPRTRHGLLTVGGQFKLGQVWALQNRPPQCGEI